MQGKPWASWPQWKNYVPDVFDVDGRNRECFEHRHERWDTQSPRRNLLYLPHIKALVAHSPEEALYL